MSVRNSRLLIEAALCLVLSIPALAQFGQVDGYVNGPDGKPVQGAIIGFDKLDANYHVEGKSDKKGNFSIVGIPAGDYNVTVKVDGLIREHRDMFHVSAGRQSDTSGNSALGLIFRLKPVEVGAAKAARVSAAAPGGAAKAKSRDEDVKRNSLVTDSFSAAKTALANGQYDEAIDALNKAATADPRQAPVWGALSDAWIGKSRKLQGAEAEACYEKAAEAFGKAIELAPNDAGFYNNYALSLAAVGKLDEAKGKLAKAIELEPPGAGKYYYNLGALLLNRGQVDAAVEQFKKAVAADPKYAEAHFQYAMALLGKATVDASGKIAAPEAADELHKYLALAPSGTNAQAAKEMLASLGK
jgi:tetratricopeptide (TPR) repeat protein